MRLDCPMCGTPGDAAEPGVAVLCLACSERYVSARCLECGVLQTSSKAKLSEICSECVVRAEWPTLPAEARAEFDRLLLEGHRILAIRVACENLHTQSMPRIHWGMEALVYRSKVLGLDGS